MTAPLFHPAVAAWFDDQFDAPSPVQARAWPAIRGGNHTLLAAPTGSGKTLAAFLSIIDDLVRESLAQGLADETRVLYVSPLKALSNDIQKNLETPLAGIRDQLLTRGLPDAPIRAWVRTGDTPQSERARMRKRPPHILVTTPESLYILLTSDSGRAMLSTVRTVILDEIHAVAGNKRGAHLALSLERLAALCERPFNRVGISATQEPIESMAAFLTGSEASPCTIVDTGHQRERDLALEVPKSPLEAIMANEVWSETYDRLASLIAEHRTTLIFVNTRRLAERVARHLAERIGEDLVTAHHGSLARKHRLRAEERLKAGELKALVATASLELGIDIGDVDLVCQLGSPRGIATLVQRVGRSGHGLDRLPKGRLFPLTRDDLMECTALLNAVAAQQLDRVTVPESPLDVLAQQIVAEVSNGEWEVAALLEAFRAAYPYRNLSEQTFRQVIDMLARGFATQRGRRGAYLHFDSVNDKLRPRRAARLTAITNGGAIPDQFDYDVVLVPDEFSVGTLNEDFAFESMPGDIFQLGNTSYRIVKVETGRVYVQDAQGQPPNIPFWFGEAPGRSDELSRAVSELRQRVADGLGTNGVAGTLDWLTKDMALPAAAAEQLLEYLATARAALGVLPTQERIVLERFFDEGGDTHLVVHSPYGSRINRAWGLALRKRFCRRFNFELQAAALEDTIVLSLGATHSFILSEVMSYLSSTTVRDVLTQALLAAPMFPTHWRWNATTALAVKRFRNGKKTPPQFQRNDAEDLMAVVFPDQLACAENLAGEREIPDHPLVRQTIDDCLHDLMDIAGLERLLRQLEQGEIEVVCCELTTPSPLAQEVLNARPYAFLDDAPAEERRTLAVQTRRYMSVEQAGELGRLDSEAIARVRAEAWPQPRDPDELHDGLVMVGFMTGEEITPSNQWRAWLEQLTAEGRVTSAQVSGGSELWVSMERLPELKAALPKARFAATAPVANATWDADTALRELVRSRLEGLGPVTADTLAAPLAVSGTAMNFALQSLEAEGFAMQGQFTPGNPGTEWCERGLLARIHRYTLKRLRSEIEPVAIGDYMRFLFSWQGLGRERRAGPESLAAVIDQLQGFPIQATAWERHVLPARIADYSPLLMDQLCATGAVVWRKVPGALERLARAPQGLIARTTLALFPRRDLVHWQNLAKEREPLQLSPLAARVAEQLAQGGAQFFVDLVTGSGALRVQVEEALAELVANGMVTADGFAGLRALITPGSKRRGFGTRGRRRRGPSFDSAGRWSLVNDPTAAAELEQRRDAVEHVAQVLLDRYGVVVRRVLERETALPPWRELLQVFRRLEAQGLIRGGRFVNGLSGEQFALPEALAHLRKTRRRQERGDWVLLSAADPFNLVGILTAGARVPAVASHLIVFKDGWPVACKGAGDVVWLGPVDPADEWQARNILLRGERGAGYLGRQPGGRAGGVVDVQ
jgi:ATP-dependent Lhr-like helicase